MIAAFIVPPELEPHRPGSSDLGTRSASSSCAPAEREQGAWRRRLLLGLFNLYPPFLGAGIRLRPSPRGPGAIEARMHLRFWNRNVVGTHYGGSLYSLCDPWFVIILRQKLGRGYIVWDKWASIRFRRPGRGTVTAVFDVPAAMVDEIRAQADRGEAVEPRFQVEVTDGAGQVVAVVEKLLHVRRQDAG